MKMNPVTFDAQPTVNSGILVMVGGECIIEGSENPIKFAQVFVLQEGGSVGYYCKCMAHV